MYVANESDQEVFFDELEVAHTPTLIAQENHYYPYGMNMVGIEKQGMPHHRFQYNAQTERETAFHLHWDETPFRRYDAQLGRFHGVDALASSYAGITPYQYGFNNPVMFNDPTGLLPDATASFGSPGSTFMDEWAAGLSGGAAGQDGWQRRQEQGEFERNLNPWDYAVEVSRNGQGIEKLEFTENGLWIDFTYKSGTLERGVVAKRSQFVAYNNLKGKWNTTTHTAKNGDVLYVGFGGLNEVVRHRNIESRAKWDENKDKLLKSKGEVMGHTLHPFSFIDFDLFQSSRGDIRKAVGTIDFSSSWAHEVIGKGLKEASILDIFTNAGYGEKYDLKNNNPGKQFYYGSMIYIQSGLTNGVVYASARDAGNFLAGGVAGRSGVPMYIIMRGFGAYNITKSKWKMMGLLTFDTLVLGRYLGSKKFHGEDALSGLGIHLGYSNQHRFPN